MFWLFLPAAFAGPHEVTRAHLDGVAADLRVVDFAAGARVRVQQRLGGLPVEGRDQVWVVDADGVRARRGPPMLVGDIGPAVLGQDDALKQAEGVLDHLGSGRLWPSRATQVVAAVDGRPKRAWAVDGSTAAPPGTWRILVDATDGALIGTRSTSFTAEGRVYEVSPALGRPTRVTLQNLTSATELSGVWAEARSCDDADIDDSVFGIPACHGVSAHALPDLAGDYLFPPDPASLDDPMAEVHVYHHVDRVAQRLFDDLGFTLGGPIRAHVNFEMENAFFSDFDGDGVGDLSFGQSPDGIDYAYDADVVYHEFGHAVVTEISSIGSVRADAFGMDWAGGSLNEGSADALSMLLTDDPYTGEYAGGKKPIRDLEVDRRCPDDLQGEVHADGQIWGSVWWNLRQDIGVDASLQLLYGTVSLWTVRTTWEDAGETLLTTARDMERGGLLSRADLEAVEAEVRRANLTECGRVRPVVDGEVVQQFVMNGGLEGSFAYVPGGTQLVYTVPEDADVAFIDVLDFEGPKSLGYSLFVRRGEPVRHVPTQLEQLGLGISEPVDFDDRLDGRRGGVRFSVHDLEPGTELYISLAGRDAGGIEYFDFRFGKATVAVRGARSVPPPKASPGGCGCRTGTPSPGWGLLLVLVAVRRRMAAWA